MSTTPLGIREEYLATLGAGEASMLERLSEWPLDVLVRRLSQSGLFADEADIHRHFVTYRQFMFFKGGSEGPGFNPDNICAMYSQKVDAIWHTHILYTRDYATFCNAVFGRFIHHTPCDQLDMSSAVLDMNNWLNDFQDAFGELPDDFDWKRFPIQCG